MRCPVCQAEMLDVTESWHTFAEAEGAEYLAEYVTIWMCSSCKAMVGESEEQVEWVMEADHVAAE